MGADGRPFQTYDRWLSVLGPAGHHPPAPWPGKVPFTAGDRRTVGDVALYLSIVATLVTALVLPSVSSGPWTGWSPETPAWSIRPYCSC